jgi:uncharacterized protein DUF6458
MLEPDRAPKEACCDPLADLTSPAISRLGSSICGYQTSMGIGTSIILIAVGAILRFAVTLSTKNVNWHIVGDVLMVVGIVGLVVSLIWAATVARRTNGQTTTVVER